MHHDDAELRPYLDRYANWSGLRTVALTFDIDWAPDYMIEAALAVLDGCKVRATFFATHDSDLLRRVAAEGRHEVGLHPNLSANSTQGKNIEEVIANLRRAYPGAVGQRFHVLAMSYRDLLWLGANGFSYDVSRILFNAPYLVPAWHKDLNMTLLPYMWEDGVCENQGLTPAAATIDLVSPGLKIMNFHPMNAFINCATRDDRVAFQRANPNLLNTPQEKARPFQRAGDGAGRALEDLCRILERERVETACVRDLAAAFPRRLYGAP